MVLASTREVATRSRSMSPLAVLVFRKSLASDERKSLTSIEPPIELSRARPLESSRVTSPPTLVASIALETRRISTLPRSEEHTSELQSRQYLVCRLLLEKKND